MNNYKVTVDGELVVDTNPNNPQTTKEDIFRGLEAAVNSGQATEKDFALYKRLKKIYGFKKGKSIVDKKNQQLEQAQMAAMMANANQKN